MIQELLYRARKMLKKFRMLTKFPPHEWLWPSFAFSKTKHCVGNMIFYAVFIWISIQCGVARSNIYIKCYIRIFLFIILIYLQQDTSLFLTYHIYVLFRIVHIYPHACARVCTYMYASGCMRTSAYALVWTDVHVCEGVCMYVLLVIIFLVQILEQKFKGYM